ncbi:MAG TPA: serine hydrolase, partial [Actinomycetota bacterium]|nr:serine hydrolase [Actinomycetota bacterium]
GQHALWRIFPDENLAVTLLTNGPGSREVFKDLFSEISGIKIPDQPKVPDDPPKLDLSRYAGSYERLAIRYDLAEEDGKLAGTVTVSGPLAKMIPDPVTHLSMTPVDEKTFLVFSEDAGEEPGTAAFYDFVDGVPRYMHSGARANRRVGD